MSERDGIAPVAGDAGTHAALKLWVVLARAYNAIADAARRDIENHGLSPTEFGVLELLYHKGPLTLGDVGERVLLTSGGTTYVIDKLETRGLLARRACAEDRRVVYAELTDAGRALIGRIFPLHADAILHATRGLTTAEKRQAAELLKRLGRTAREG